MTVIAWRGAGTSDGSLTWRSVRGGCVQRFPWGYYGPRVLDEHWNPADGMSGLWRKTVASRSGHLRGKRNGMEPKDAGRAAARPRITRCERPDGRPSSRPCVGVL